jgi:hypothetical protein
MADYDLLEGKPSRFVELFCVECKRTVLKLPLDCVVLPKKSVIINNMSCALKGHPIKLRLCGD